MDNSAANAEAVFTLALELPAGAARDEFIAKRCAGDSALWREVKSLLHAHDEAGGFLGEPDSKPAVSNRFHHVRMEPSVRSGEGDGEGNV